MPRKRKRRMKLPNSFGSIKYLDAGRRNPYAVYPPVTEWTPKGPVTPPALDYVKTWEAGYELLTAYSIPSRTISPMLCTATEPWRSSGKRLRR